MRKLRIIDEIRDRDSDISYRAFEGRSGAAVSYGIEMEYERDGEVCREILFDVTDDRDYVQKMNCVFAENGVLPEAFEETAEVYICSVRV